VSRVLLLNPPGTKNYIRDYFCSKLSKSHYISPPVTMLALSGILAEQHELIVLDAMVEALSRKQCLARIRAVMPEAIITLVGAASWDEDRAFLEEVKNATTAYITAIGDVLLEDTEIRLEEACGIDAALLNFATPDILALIPRPDGRIIPNVVYRGLDGRGYVNGGITKLQGEFHIPRPRHELFPLRRYRFPFMVSHPMTAVLTDYGCPFACAFCVMPTLGFGLRPLCEVIEELIFLKNLGIKEIFFLDQTFGVQGKRTLELCRAMQQSQLRFKWSCFSRVDVLKHDMLEVMAASGCHTIIFGVESGSEATLARYGKRVKLERIQRTLAACRKAGIRTGATFILGLPGENEVQARTTLALALKLPLDFAAFNVAVPRARTGLRAQEIAAGLIAREESIMDQSGRQGAVSTRELPAGKISALRQEAIRRFYFRPAYLLRRLLCLRSWWDFKTQVWDGIGVLADAWGREK
jgi:hypothetical protein